MRDESTKRDEPKGDYGREIRDTIVKSSLTGVAATVLAAAVFSPAGLGGMVGTSLASGLGADPGVAPADDPYANLPAFPAPMSQDELSQIRGELAATAAAMEITRAATEAKVEHIRAIALTGVDTPIAPVPDDYSNARVGGGLRLALSEPALAPHLAPAGYQGGGGAAGGYVGSHLELADLMFAHEEF